MENLKFRAYNPITKDMLYSFEAPSLGAFFIGVSLAPESIIMQSTDLVDNKGVEIYNGDIVVNHHDDNKRIVKRCNQNASYYLSHINNEISYYKEFVECAQSQSDGLIRLDNIEVIGNIYQHPQLTAAGIAINNEVKK